MENLRTSQLIKQKREERGMTQEELALTFNPPISRATVNRWENGHVAKMKVSHFKHLCDIFECEPSELLGLDWEAEEIADKYKKAPTEVREIIKKLLNYHAWSDENES